MTTSLTPNAQRILGIIYVSTLPPKGSYIAGWHICDALGVDRGQLNTALPGTEYDEALRALINAELVEELPDLHYRYRLTKKGQ